MSLITGLGYVGLGVKNVEVWESFPKASAVKVSSPKGSLQIAGQNYIDAHNADRRWASGYQAPSLEYSR